MVALTKIIQSVRSVRVMAIDIQVLVELQDSNKDLEVCMILLKLDLEQIE